MKITKSFWLALFFAAIIGTAVATAAQYPWATRLFPWAVGIPALFLALWQVVVELTRSQASDGSGETAPTQILDIQTDQSIPSEVVWRHTGVAWGWILSFVFFIWLVGFLIAIPLFVFAYLWREAHAKIKVSGAIAVLITIFIWGLFDQVMNIAWPEPFIFTILGF